MKNPLQKRISLFGLGVVLVTMACVCTGSGGLGDLLPQDNPDGAVYFDDFSNPLSGWAQYSGTDGINDYADGGYRILVNETEYFSWSIIDESFSDASIEVQIKRMAGPFDAEAGIVCRYQDDDNFYLSSITADGFYAIAKISNGDFTVLSGSGEYVESSSINQGNSSNSLRADCVGSTLTLYVNGTLVDSASDFEFSNGDVGLVAGTFTEAGADIQFDDFAVYIP